MALFQNLKFLNLCLLLSSLFGYLEWGTENSAFLFQTELELIATLFTNPSSVLHPFVLLPLGGQFLLLYTLFQKEPSRLLTYVGIGGIGILLALMFFIGIISANLKILGSTFPFLLFAALTIINLRRKSNESTSTT